MNYETMNDYELMYLIEENHEDAYDLVVKKYRPLLDKLVRKYLLLANKYGLEYDDLYQAGLIGVHYAITHYQKKANTLLYTFVLLCVRGRMLNLIRVSSTKNSEFFHQSLSLSCPISEYDYSLDDVVSSSYSIMDIVITDELQLLLVNFKNTLHFESSSIFELKVNGFSANEISSLLELSPKTVNNIIFQLKKKLRKYLNLQKYI